MTPEHSQNAVDTEATLREYLKWEADHAERSLLLFGHGLTPAERESQVRAVQRARKILEAGASEQELRRHLYEFRRRRPTLLAPVVEDRPLAHPIRGERDGGESVTGRQASA